MKWLRQLKMHKNKPPFKVALNFLLCVIHFKRRIGIAFFNTAVKICCCCFHIGVNINSCNAKCKRNQNSPADKRPEDKHVEHFIQTEFYKWYRRHGYSSFPWKFSTGYIIPHIALLSIQILNLLLFVTVSSQNLITITKNILTHHQWIVDIFTLFSYNYHR